MKIYTGPALGEDEGLPVEAKEGVKVEAKAVIVPKERPLETRL